MNIVYRLRIAPSAMAARAALGSGGVTIPLLGRKQTMNEGCRGTNGCSPLPGPPVVVSFLDHFWGNEYTCLEVSIYLFFCPTVGTFKIRDEQIISSVIDTALECGYRLIGTLPKLALFPRFCASP